MSRITGWRLATIAGVLAIPLLAGACTSDPNDAPPGVLATSAAPVPTTVVSDTAPTPDPSTPVSTDASTPPSLDNSPAASTLNPNFGASTGDTEVTLIKSPWADSYVAAAADLGVGISRFDVKWDGVQASRGGPYDFTAYEPIIAAMVAKGIEPQPILGSTPKWAADKGCKIDYYACPPADINDAAAFAAAFATKFGGNISKYEMTDSPEGRLKPQRYVELLRLTAEKIRAADSGAQIILSMDPGTDWPTQLFQLGAANSFDGFNVQAMTWPASAKAKNSTVARDITAMYNVLANNGGGTKFIQLTVGFPTAGEGSVTANRQGPLLGDAFDSAAELKKSGVNIGAVFTFSLRDIGPIASDNPWDHMGLATQNGDPKPAWATVKQYISTHR